MSKAFVRDDGDDDGADDEPEAPGTAVPGGRNYITPAGHARMRAELLQLLDVERPSVVQVVSWAASNGDRSENGDYLYGKKRLREIDRRIRFLTRRLDQAEVVDSSAHRGSDQIFFGAEVEYVEPDGTERAVRIVGVDEIDPLRGRISWISPVARALLRARDGDTVSLMTPHGPMQIDVTAVRYPQDDSDGIGDADGAGGTRGAGTDGAGGARGAGTDGAGAAGGTGMDGAGGAGRKDGAADGSAA